MDALYRILYQYRGCLHTTVRVLQRILSRQAGGLPDQQKVVSAPNPGMFSEHAGTNQRFASFPKNQTYPERSDNVFWEKNQNHFYLRFLALSL